MWMWIIREYTVFMFVIDDYATEMLPKEVILPSKPTYLLIAIWVNFWCQEDYKTSSSHCFSILRLWTLSFYCCKETRFSGKHTL